MRRKEERRNKSLEYLTGMTKVHLMKIDEHLFMIREVWEAFYRMKNEAEKDGVRMKIVSAFRSFRRQRTIWNSKVRRYTRSRSIKDAVYLTLKFTAFPGTSRHHWGTEIDIAGEREHPDPLNNEHFKKGGIYHDVYTWLLENAERFGFYQVYISDIPFPSLEMWHWSYAPLSREMLKRFIKEVKPSMFRGKGILGEKVILTEWASYVENYLLSINPVLNPLFSP